MLSARRTYSTSALNKPSSCKSLKGRVVTPARLSHARVRATSEQPVMLPGALWLPKPADAAAMPVYGPSFVIKRSSVPTPSTSQCTAIRPVTKPWTQCLDASLSAALGSNLSLVYNSSSGCSLVAISVAPPTAMTVVEVPTPTPEQDIIDVDPIEQASMSPATASSGTGSTFHLPESEEQAFFETSNSSSPRRTQKVKFTCNICGSTNVKPINPHAWQTGSVFARCSKCNVTHKLIDNLKIFHECAGPIFPPRLKIDLPPSLPNPLDDMLP